ncbi:hypothetical protein EA82_02289 [Enterococcus hirae]|uniref:DUF1642 domain-containing protein n=1 Tax=Enterococcus hirae TaxID=1354 RepID=UPI000DE95A5F|nr:DUF1642 domain-containing protein [Enterococcus hirae]RBT67825.1 hypothetical protein EA82_02289 [Enterococcus hirae]
MNKQKLIDKYTAEISRLRPYCPNRHLISEQLKYDLYKEILEDLKQLDEPQKPVVPKFVADWIELCKEKADLISCLSGSYEYGVNQYKRITEDEDWLFEADHQELVARAWLFGYEVEKEPLYCVKIGKGYFSGFDETKVTYVIDDAPGALAQRVKYETREEAEMDAIQIGGTVEEVAEG